MKTSLGRYFRMSHAKTVAICNKLTAEVGFCAPQAEISTKRGFQTLRELNCKECCDKLIATQYVRSAQKPLLVDISI